MHDNLKDLLAAGASMLAVITDLFVAPDIAARKGKTPIVCLTAYTAPMAELLDEHLLGFVRGVDIGIVAIACVGKLFHQDIVVIVHAKADGCERHAFLDIMVHFFEDAIARVRTLPGVDAVSIAASVAVHLSQRGFRVRLVTAEGTRFLAFAASRALEVAWRFKTDALGPRPEYNNMVLGETFGNFAFAIACRVLGLRDMLRYFVEHRHQVVRRRAEYELRKAREREHILEGLKIAVDNIDEVIGIIRGSETTSEAGERLRTRFGLTDRQSDAILNMRLARLTGLEIEQLEAELGEVRATIADLEDILTNLERRKSIIKDELNEVADRFGDERRTDLLGMTGSFSIEDLIPDEEMVITVSHSGYIKRVPSDTYRAQARGGRGIEGMKTKEEDWVEHLFLANTHDYLMFFTRDGQCYWLKVHEIPVGSRNSRGKPVVNLINIAPDEKIAALVPVRTFSPDRSLIFATRKGVVKKTSLASYGNPRRVGLNAMNVLEGDELISVQLADGSCNVVLGTRDGMAIRFEERDVREMGRATTGVRGITLMEDDVVIGMVVTKPGSSLLVVSELGMGKRTVLEAYRCQRRGGKGVINLRTGDKTGRVVAVKEVHPGDELMMITREGIIIRSPVDQIRVIGRNTQGVRLINLGPKDAVMDVARVVNEDEEPMPISADIPEGQEVVDSSALEEALGIDDLDGDAGDEPEDFIEEDEGPDSVDELLDDGEV